MPNKDTAKTGLGPELDRLKPVAWLLLFIGFLFVISLVWFNHHVAGISYKDVKIGHQTYSLQVAKNTMALQKGLSGRDGLGQNQGMLFDFKANGNWRMWMIDMHFAIDMAWLNRSGQIIYIKTDATPASYPATFGTSRPSWYVIEVPAYTFNRQNIKVGDTIKIS